MDRLIWVYSAELPDLSGLEESGWCKSRTGGFVLTGRDWEAVISAPRSIEVEDAPPEAVELEPSIAWCVEATLLSGSDSGARAGLRRVMAALKALAGSEGVIADEDEVWRGRCRRRWSPPREPGWGEAGRLTMVWFAPLQNLVTEGSIRSLLATVAEVLPEALPVRWGDTEPFGHGLDDEGLEGLISRYAKAQDRDGVSADLVLTRVRAPFIGFDLGTSRCLGWLDWQRAKLASLQIELGVSFLDRPEAGSRLATAFKELSKVIQPFYAEARIQRGFVETEHGWMGVDQSDWTPLPVVFGRWTGFPQTPPLAMVVGPPYRSHWVDLGGEKVGDLIVYSSPTWPDSPAGGVPVAPPGFLQEAATGRGPLPRRVPPVWPFDMPSHKEQARQLRQQMPIEVFEGRPGGLQLITEYTILRGSAVHHAYDPDTDMTLCGFDADEFQAQPQLYIIGRRPSCPDCDRLARDTVGEPD